MSAKQISREVRNPKISRFTWRGKLIKTEAGFNECDGCLNMRRAERKIVRKNEND